MFNNVIQFILSILILVCSLTLFNKYINIFGVIKNFRVYSIYYSRFAYFVLFSIIIIFYSKYIVTNHITPIPIVALLLPFVVMLIIPIGILYYIIRASIHIAKIANHKFQENKINKLIWISDVIYLIIFVILIYIEISV